MQTRHAGEAMIATYELGCYSAYRSIFQQGSVTVCLINMELRIYLFHKTCMDDDFSITIQSRLEIRMAEKSFLTVMPPQMLRWQQRFSWYMQSFAAIIFRI